MQPCRQRVIEQVSSKEEPTADFPLPCSLEEACVLFLDGPLGDLQNPSRQNAKKRARRRLKKLYKDALPETWDLPFKVFRDLDIVFFQGELTGRVYLCWELIEGETGSVGETKPSPHPKGRIRIRLRYNYDWSSLPARSIIGVLAHQMVHAWFSLKCGSLYTERESHGIAWTKGSARYHEVHESSDLVAYRRDNPTISS